MVRLEPVLVVALAVSLLWPAVVAHEGGDGVLNVVASPDTPRVGEMVDLTYYLLEEGRLVPHVDTDVHLTQNGEHLLSLASTHEHDGVHHATVRFTEPGPFSYTVLAETADGSVERTVTGEVLPAGERTDVELHVDAPGSVSTGEAFDLHVRLEDPDDGRAAGGEDGDGSSAVTLEGGPQNHTTWIRLYREPTGKLVRRAEIGSTETMAEPLVTALNVPGTYTLQVEAYPADGATFRPVVERRTIGVEAGPGPVPLDAPWDPTLTDRGSGPGDASLHVEVDPATQVGPLTDLKIDALMLDGAHPVPDVVYSVQVEGPRGAKILSLRHSLQPDGIAEWFAHTPVPGTYEIEVLAQTADGTEREATTSYTVVPPTEAGVPGTVQPAFDGILDGEGPHQMGLAFEDATGEPMQHVEADLEVYAPGEEAPRWTTKLHTHDHDVTWTAGFGTDGGHYLKVNPSPQSPTAETIWPPGGPTAELGFGFHVDAPDPVAAVTQPEDAPGEPTPWPTILAVAALAAAAVWRRRV